MALQDIKSNSAVKNSLDICSANDEMLYSGQLNTIQRELPQLLLDSSASFLLLPESFLLVPAFAFLYLTIAVMHKKKQYAHYPLKAFPALFSEGHIFFLVKVLMHIALTARS